MYTITVTGAGYVGISNALVLAKGNKVFITDIDAGKIAMLKKRRSPIADMNVEKCLLEENIDLTPTMNAAEAYVQSDYVIIATPTNYDDEKNSFDTSSVEAVICDVLAVNPNAVMIIKSTIPIGFTTKMSAKFHTNKLLFSPEFLREGKALYDNLNPSRIIVSTTGDMKTDNAARTFADLLRRGAEKDDVPILFLEPSEAEAVKLFANTYLAMRVAFFNEIDTFAQKSGLNAKEIIEGICLDPRIGTHYNNPSFGYGGYCLPKDTKQLLANYENIPQNIIGAIIDSNETRKKFVAEHILKKTNNKTPTVGIYRLIMKSGSDNFRQSAVLGVMEHLIEMGAKIIVYEPSCTEEKIFGYAVESNFEKFAAEVDVIAANRISEQLETLAGKVFTCDIYYRD